MRLWTALLKLLGPRKEEPEQEPFDRRKRGLDPHIDMLLRSLEVTSDPHTRELLKRRIEAAGERINKQERRWTRPRR
jgi:hypothetical protein